MRALSRLGCFNDHYSHSLGSSLFLRFYLGVSDSLSGGDVMEWRLISEISEVREPCLLFDPSEDRVYVGQFEDWYEPEWADQEGNTLTIMPTHWMPLPAPPKQN